MKLRTLGLLLGIVLGAVMTYARAEGSTLIGHRGDETLRLFDRPCTNPTIVEKIQLAEAAAKQEFLSAFKQGEYVFGKEAPMAACYRKTIDPEGDYIFLFEDGGSGHSSQDEFQPEGV